MKASYDLTLTADVIETGLPEITVTEDDSGSTGILLSTLWSQSGVLHVGSNTTITCNEYTPIDPTTSEHSVTGCTNTAAAQIIHYFIEKGLLDLSLTLVSSDAYTSERGSIVISVKSDGSTPGTISFAAVNNYLGNYSVDSAACAAALLYACGVVQQADYSSAATSTAWSPELFYRAGFQSADKFIVWGTSKDYYWGTTDASGKASISDAGFEVIIENLRAGRPVGASVPGHAVVIDGYDAENDLFHINYGWGDRSSSTKWYTRKEMREDGYHEFVYDLFTERIGTFTVTDRRAYGTGTLVRAFEQARTMTGDNTVRFSPTVDGKAVELNENVKLADSTSVRNFNMTVTVTDAHNISWGIGFYGEEGSVATFTDFGGALIVDTAMSTNVAVNSYRGDALSFSADHALIYAGSYAVGGSYSAGANAILGAMRSARDNATEPGDLVTASAGYSFYGTDGDDLIALAGRSLVVGTLALWGGDDTVSLNGGSRLYGYINCNGGAEVTVTGGSQLHGDIYCNSGLAITVTDGSYLSGNISGGGAITVDSSSELAGLIYSSTDLRLVLDSAAEDHALFTIESNVANVYSKAAVTVDIADAEVGTYILFAAAAGASYADWLNRITVTVTGSGKSDYTLCGSGTSTSEYADLFYEDRMLKLNVKKAPSGATPKVVSVAADITAATERDVTVTAAFNGNVATAQYSLDGSTWRAYENGVAMSKNGTVYFRGLDAADHASEVVEYEVANILAVPAPVSGDLNGDGRADIVMTISRTSHPHCGATGAWLIKDTQTAEWGDLSTRESGWEIFGTGVTAAGKETCDVYVRSSGNVVGAWTTDTTGKVAGWETVGEFDASTQVLGLGDFNGDGQTDLLLRNTNGAVGCYFTSGETLGWNYFQSLGNEWSICAVGDLNGDGRDDVVLKHDAGFAGSWLTQADCTMAWADLDTLPEGFAIVGAGDFDGDGTSDVLLKNGNYYGAWLVQNGRAAGWMGLGDLGNVTVEQIGDFDADGIDDLRIRTSAGDLGAQLVKGADSLQWKYYGSVGSEWSTSLAAIQ